ncbi:MAG: glycosyltransferase family 4 protein [Deltaproteobacteria bacterium]|nr:glycosyltransferase family 4 protein [Deltaproteobacteria bacterium]
MNVNEIQRQTPLKILFLTSSYPRTPDDTAGIFLRHLAEHLAKRGLNIHVLAPSDGASKTSTAGGITVHRFRYFLKRAQRLAYGSGILHNLRQNPSLWIEVPFFVGSMSYFLMRLARKEKFDLIHAHWLLPQGLAAVYTERWHRVPVLTTAHGSDAFGVKAFPFQILKRNILHRSAAWTANSHATAEALRADTETTGPRIIPMGVNVERFGNGNRNRLRTGLKDDDFVLLFVGRLVEGKGIDYLLQALALLPWTLLNRTTLWVVGEGQDLSRLTSFADDLGVAHRVRFWGQIENDALPDVYAAADLFIAPASGAEGQAVVLAEAFAARLCVLATRIGGIQEVVADGVTGMLVQPQDSQALAGGIEKLLTDSELRQKLASNGFLRARTYFAWETVAARFEDLYQGIVEKASQEGR